MAHDADVQAELERLRSDAARWRAETVYRASEIASHLGVQLLAARRLAEAVDAMLGGGAGFPQREQVAQRLAFFQRVCDQPAAGGGASAHADPTC